jgi:hypothetical protein
MWLREHQTEYTAKQLSGLVALTSPMITNKTTKSALIKTLDDILLAKKKQEEAAIASAAAATALITSTSSTM